MNAGVDPQTTEEWQEAVDVADALLRLESARAYGLVRGGPRVNQERCEEIVRRGAERGIHPSEGNVERLINAMAVEAHRRGD